MNTKTYKVIKWILDYVPELIAAIALCVAVTVSAVNAFSRYTFSHTFLGYDELIRIAFAWVVFPGAAAAYWRHMHFGIDLITNLCPKKIQAVIDVVMQAFMTFLLIVLCHLSITLTREVGVKYFPVTFVSYAYYDAAMVVGFSFMSLYSAIFTVQKVQAFFKKNNNDEINDERNGDA